MSASEMLDAALDGDRDSRIARAAERFIAAEAAVQAAEDMWDPLNISVSGIRSQTAEKNRRLAFEVLKGEVNKERQR